MHELSQRLGKISLKMVLLALAGLAVVWAIGWLAFAGLMLLIRKRPAKMTPFALRRTWQRPSGDLIGCCGAAESPSNRSERGESK